MPIFPLEVGTPLVLSPPNPLLFLPIIPKPKYTTDNFEALKQFQAVAGHLVLENPTTLDQRYEMYNSTMMVGLGSLHPSLLSTSAPNYFKRPRVEKYEGLTDHRPGSCQHIFSKNQWFTFRDDILCRAFPETLKGTMYHWFVDPPYASITCFSKLTRLFFAQHVEALRVKKGNDARMKIKKNEVSL